MEPKMTQVTWLKGVTMLAAVLAFGLQAPCATYAHSGEAEAAQAVTSLDAMSDSDSPVRRDEKLTRFEKIERWLENHPRIKEKIDADRDGTVEREEFKEARQTWIENHPRAAERLDANDDGNVDRAELQRGRRMWQEHQNKNARRDEDNNPPGAAGGRGTNWENAPGAAGGPGASPDQRRSRQDRDNNPPGLAGGRGTNWENRPGPSGGPGASPNRGSAGRTGVAGRGR